MDSKICRILGITLVVHCFFANASLSSFDPDQMCTLIKNGTKIKDPRACDTWIECIDSQPITGVCEDQYFYDRESGECVEPESINCISSNPCATTTSNQVFVADPYSCNGYYYCEDGSASHGICNAGMNFNPGTEACVRNFPCASKMNPDSICNIVPDGVFVKDMNNCNGYSMCWEGTVVNGTCSGTFYFDPLNGTCDYPSKVNCVETTTVLPNMPSVDLCKEKNEFLSDDYTCNGYYLCHENTEGDMELIHGVCPTGRFFYAANSTCLGRANVQCEYDRCAGMGLVNIQLANKAASDCKGYLICQDGKTIGTGECLDNQYFDELEQRCTTDVISYAACTGEAGGSSTTLATDEFMDEDYN